MRSVADDLRADTRAMVACLEPFARVRLALELGDADAAALARARGITVTDARRVFASRKATGRIPSSVNRDAS
jgi:hypothetical protein